MSQEHDRCGIFDALERAREVFSVLARDEMSVVIIDAHQSEAMLAFTEDQMFVAQDSHSERGDMT